MSLRPSSSASIVGIKLEDDEDAFHTLLDYVTRSLDQTIKPSGSADMTAMQRHLRGLVQKAHVNNNDALASALRDTQQRLHNLTARASDLDDEIQLSRLPSHLMFLLALSTPPEPSTLQFAELYEESRKNPQSPSAGLTWEKILAEEPFEGQHWEGVYGLPPGSVKGAEMWEAGSYMSDDSTPSLSPWDGDEDSERDLALPAYGSHDAYDTERSPSSANLHTDEYVSPTLSAAARYGYRYEVEDLQARQYWKSDWKIDAPTNETFNIGEASTLGPTLRRLLGSGRQNGSAVQERYINEHDAVREVLLGLQGVHNIMIEWVHTGPSAPSYQPSPDAPALLHISLSAQCSILESFAITATTLEHLRRFVKAMFAAAAGSPSGSSQFSPRRSTRTLEAFAEAIDNELRQFDKWCASREEQICRAQAGVGDPVVVSFLSLESALRSRFSQSFTFLLDILRTLVQRSTRFASQAVSETLSPVWTLPDLPKRLRPAAITTLLLDTLLFTMQDSVSMGDMVTSNAFVRVFCSTARPLWSMIYRWLKDGMPVPELSSAPVPSWKSLYVSDEEFFIEDNELPLLDPDFWREGFVLSMSEDGPEDDMNDLDVRAIPLFLRKIAQHILEAGKAIGLLRALGIPNAVDEGYNDKWMDAWRPFEEVLKESSAHRKDNTVASTEDFARMVHDELVGPCSQAKAALTRILIDDCDLWPHLTAMQDLYLMRKGDIMTNYLDVVFARMDSNLRWDDFHFLNSSFTDIVNASSSRWIDPSLVRFSHRGGSLKSASIDRTVRAIEGLLIEYAVPFPLTYIFEPKAMQTYSSLFVFLLQIRRAKNALESILVRNANILPRGSAELKVFYAMRGRLSWFVNALLNFICTNVLHTQVLSFHNDLKKINSLDGMIDLHNDHLNKLESRCLLQRNTASLHRAIISVLDMTLHFSDCFVAYANDVTHDISRISIASTTFHRHRSRKQRHQRRNIIGFSQTMSKPPVDDLSSSSESDPEEDLASAVEPPFTAPMAASVSFADEGFVERVGKMSSELDALEAVTVLPDLGRMVTGIKKSRIFRPKVACDRGARLNAYFAFVYFIPSAFIWLPAQGQAAVGRATVVLGIANVQCLILINASAKTFRANTASPFPPVPLSFSFLSPRETRRPPASLSSTSSSTSLIMSRLTANPFAKHFEFPRAGPLLTPPDTESEYHGQALQPPPAPVPPPLALGIDLGEPASSHRSVASATTEIPQPRKGPSVQYIHSGPREARERVVQRGIRWLVVVVPPISVVTEHGHFGHTLSIGSPERLSQGVLMPLFPTMNGQLGAIAREFGFPSHAGLCLYLHTTVDGITTTPRISDESWQMLWSAYFEPRSPTSTVPTGQLPISGRIEFDIDMRKARWYEVWLGSGRRDLVDVPVSVTPSRPQSVFHWRGDSRTTFLDDQQEDQMDSGSMLTIARGHSRPGSRHIPRKLSLLDRIEGLSIRSGSRLVPRNLSPPSPGPLAREAVPGLSPVVQEDEPKTARKDINMFVNSWRASASLAGSSPLAATGQTSLDPANMPNDLPLAEVELDEELNLDDFAWSVSSLGPPDYGSWEDDDEVQSIESWRLPSVHLDRRLQGSVCLTPTTQTSWGPVWDSEDDISSASSVSRLPTPDIAARMLEDCPPTPSTATSWGPPSYPASPVSEASFALSMDIAHRNAGSVALTPTTATSWGPPLDWPPSPATPYRVHTPDVGQRSFDVDEPWHHVWPYQKSADSCEVDGRLYGFVYPYYNASSPSQPEANQSSGPWKHVWPYHPSSAEVKEKESTGPYPLVFPPYKTSSAPEPWHQVWPYHAIENSVQIEEASTSSTSKNDAEPWKLVWPYRTVQKDEQQQAAPYPFAFPYCEGVSSSAPGPWNQVWPYHTASGDDQQAAGPYPFTFPYYETASAAEPASSASTSGPWKQVWPYNTAKLNAANPKQALQGGGTMETGLALPS
ncbi:hypothetical protein NM688_g1810 [Phlebia brevispora]|uniref:Uncharacterized protein n=1 Tax=Phlebia brevispora TaxID=194682 RepID=A0ACC1TAP5_9APHY|nr:hypothetical protein NM688_g1810 [Phlebia brevispora]